MAIDIREGDILVYGGQDYPIRAVDPWVWNDDATLGGLDTITVSVKRQPALVNGKRASPATVIASITCLPLDPLSSLTQERPDLQTPHVLLETFLSSADEYYHVIVEDLSR